MSEVMISKKRLVVWLLLVLALLGAALWGYPWIRKLIPVPTPVVALQPAAPPTGDPDAVSKAAAMAGARAFYTLDYQVGRQAWLDALCAVSTQAGCAIDQNVIVPALWGGLAQAKTVSTVQVEVQGKVLEQAAAFPANTPLQVWRLHIQLSVPWPGQVQPLTSFPALALVIRENGTWKFERFLTEDEVQALEKKAGQP